MTDIRRLIGIAIGIVVICFLPQIAVIFEKFLEFIKWLVFLDNAETGLPLVAEIIIKGIAGTISFTLVGIIFKSLGLFDSNLMKFAYAVISIVVGAVLCSFVYWLINYWIIILILLSTILTILIVLTIYINKRKEKVEEHVITNS